MANKAKLIKEAVQKIRKGIADGSLHNTPVAHLKEHAGAGRITHDHLRKVLAEEAGVKLKMFRTVPHEPEINKQATKLLKHINGDPTLQTLYAPKNFQTVGFRRGHITEDLDLINNRPTLFQRLRGETEETIAAQREMKAEYASSAAEMAEQAKLNELELTNKVKLQDTETKLRQKYGLEKKPMGTAKKIALGGGAVAGGIVGYNALTGANTNAAPMMAQAQDAGAQAAMHDAMMEGSMAMPVPRPGNMYPEAPTQLMVPANYNFAPSDIAEYAPSANASRAQAQQM